MITEVYTDGGVIGHNPSKLGGTWAFVLLNADGTFEQQSGVITPAEIGMDVVTNNVTELWAAVEALERLPVGWLGKLYTDSSCTKHRLLRRKPSMKGVPDVLSDRLFSARKRLPQPLRVVLLDGHPNKHHLAAGVGKRGQPVSKWNVLCDKLCTAQAEKFRQENAESLPNKIPLTNGWEINFFSSEGSPPHGIGFDEADLFVVHDSWE